MDDFGAQHRLYVTQSQGHYYKRCAQGCSGNCRQSLVGLLDATCCLIAIAGVLVCVALILAKGVQIGSGLAVLPTPHLFDLATIMLTTTVYSMTKTSLYTPSHTSLRLY